MSLDTVLNPRKSVFKGRRSITSNIFAVSPSLSHSPRVEKSGITKSYKSVDDEMSAIKLQSVNKIIDIKK